MHSGFKARSSTSKWHRCWKNSHVWRNYCSSQCFSSCFPGHFRKSLRFESHSMIIFKGFCPLKFKQPLLCSHGGGAVIRPQDFPITFVREVTRGGTSLACFVSSLIKRYHFWINVSPFSAVVTDEKILCRACRKDKQSGTEGWYEPISPCSESFMCTSWKEPSCLSIS